MALEIPDNKVNSIYKHYSGALTKLYDEQEAKTLAKMVFQEVMHINPAQLLSEPLRLLTESEILALHFTFKELLKGKPLQYITGKAYFKGLELKVEPGVLIPRPETEELVDLVLNDFKTTQRIRIMDVGTGSGCIAVSLAKALIDAKVFAVDVEAKALSLARLNAEKYRVNIECINLDILNSETWYTLPSPIDGVVSNPPYVLASERSIMHTNVKDFEPPEALFVPDENPLIFYKAIGKAAMRIIRPQGKLYFEINEKMGKQVAQLLFEEGYHNVLVMKDYRGKDRFVVATRP